MKEQEAPQPDITSEAGPGTRRSHGHQGNPRQRYWWAVERQRSTRDLSP